MFWRNCEINFDNKQNIPGGDKSKKEKEINYGKIRINEVDMLGLKYSNDPIEVNLVDIVNIKVILY